MSENLATILALLGGLAAAVATITTAIKKVGEGNYTTIKKRLEHVEVHQRRQNVVIGYLTDWQLIGRELLRLYAAKMVSAGMEITPEMKRLQKELERELPLEQLMVVEDDENPRGINMLRRGRRRRDASSQPEAV
jgi:hypothetical protein